MSDVQHIPDLCVNLLSVIQMVLKGNTVIFDINGVRIYGKDKKTLIASGKLINGLFELKIKMNESALALVVVNEKLKITQNYGIVDSGILTTLC